MAKTNTTQITITSSGDGATSEWKPTAMTNNTGPAGGSVQMTLSVGDNTLSVPTGAMGMGIRQIPSSATVLRLKHYAGETGFALRTGQPAFITLPTGTSSVLVNSSAIEVLDVHWS